MVSNEKHWIRIWSDYSDTELFQRFELEGQDVGVITYIYRAGTSRNLTESGFRFKLLKGPLKIM